MKIIQVKKAVQTLRFTPVESVTIVVEERIDVPTSEKEAEYGPELISQFYADAEAILDGLGGALPQGTMHQLLILMLQRKASLMVVAEDRNELVKLNIDEILQTKSSAYKKPVIQCSKDELACLLITSDGVGSLKKFEVLQRFVEMIYKGE